MQAEVSKETHQIGVNSLMIREINRYMTRFSSLIATDQQKTDRFGRPESLLNFTLVHYTRNPHKKQAFYDGCLQSVILALKTNESQNN